jgi:hypothetical protein
LWLPGGGKGVSQTLKKETIKLAKQKQVEKTLGAKRRRCGLAGALLCALALSAGSLPTAEAKDITLPADQNQHITDSGFDKVYVPLENNAPLPGGNKVTVTGAVSDGHIVGGVRVAGGDAENNAVNITGAATVGTSGTSRHVIGGLTMGGGDAHSNSVNVNTSGTVYGHITGGAAMGAGGDALNNTAAVEAGTISGDVYGGGAGLDASGAIANGATANGNTVNIHSGNIDNAFGGHVWKTGGGALADRNQVFMRGGSADKLYGAYIAADGDARGNRVEISGGSVNGTVRGAHVAGAGQALDNTVEISGGTLPNTTMIYGARANDAGSLVSGNSVTISGGTVNGWIFGGVSNEGDVINNRVSISGGSVNLNTDKDIIGGESWGRSGSEASNAGNVQGNAVEINGAADVSARNIYGGHLRGSGENSGNSVTIDASGTVTASQEIAGGYSQDNGSTVKNNTVNIKGGTINATTVAGASYHTASGQSGHRLVSHNTVNISGGDLSGVTEGVFGGRVDAAGGGPGIQGSAIHNTVVISNAPNLAGVDVYGGLVDNNAGVDVFTGNTLKMHNYSGASTLGMVANFENYDFILASGQGIDQPVLQVNSLVLGNGAGANSKLSSLSLPGASAASLQTRDKLTLIAAGAEAA